MNNATTIAVVVGLIVVGGVAYFTFRPRSASAAPSIVGDGFSAGEAIADSPGAVATLLGFRGSKPGMAVGGVTIERAKTKVSNDLLTKAFAQKTPDLVSAKSKATFSLRR